MDPEQKVIACSVLVAVAVNIVASFVLLPYVEEGEKNPAALKELEATGKFNHLLYTNTEIPLLSSLFLGGIVYLSVAVGMSISK